MDGPHFPYHTYASQAIDLVAPNIKAFSPSSLLFRRYHFGTLKCPLEILKILVRLTLLLGLK
jgi:hypothetical protein